MNHDNMIDDAKLGNRHNKGGTAHPVSLGFSTSHQKTVSLTESTFAFFRYNHVDFSLGHSSKLSANLGNANTTRSKLQKNAISVQSRPQR